jgi:hypothetical protein
MPWTTCCRPHTNKQPLDVPNTHCKFCLLNASHAKSAACLPAGSVTTRGGGPIKLLADPVNELPIGQPSRSDGSPSNECRLLLRRQCCCSSHSTTATLASLQHHSAFPGTCHPWGFNIPEFISSTVHCSCMGLLLQPAAAVQVDRRGVVPTEQGLARKPQQASPCLKLNTSAQ